MVKAGTIILAIDGAKTMSPAFSALLEKGPRENLYSSSDTPASTEISKVVLKRAGELGQCHPQLHTVESLVEKGRVLSFRYKF